MLFSKIVELGGLFERKLFKTYWSRGSTRQPVVVEKICILPIGSGLWFPVKVWTTGLSKTASRLQQNKAQAALLEATMKAQLDALNKRIKEVGYHAPEVMVSSDDRPGVFRMVKFDGSISVEFSEDSFKLETGPKKPEYRTEVYEPTIKLHRPRQNNSGKGNNGNNNGG